MDEKETVWASFYDREQREVAKTRKNELQALSCEPEEALGMQ